MEKPIDKAAINAKHCPHWDTCHRRCMVINDCTHSFFYDPVGKQKPDRIHKRKRQVRAY